MRANRRSMRVMLLWLVALLVLLAWPLRDRSDLPPDHAQLVIACDGKIEERRFLVDEADTTVEGRRRKLTAGHGFVVYKMPAKDCKLTRVGIQVSEMGGYRLEFSPDGTDWHTLFNTGRLAKGNRGELAFHTCGFPEECRDSVMQTEMSYFRFRAADERQDWWPAIERLILEVSSAAPPDGFRKVSVVPMALMFLPARLTILIGFGAVMVCRLRWHTPWRLFGIGALLWMFAGLAKAGFAWAGNQSVAGYLRAILSTTSANIALSTYIGLLTGMFECGVLLLIAEDIRQRQYNWRHAASLGVGFGAMEAIAVGAVMAIAIMRDNADMNGGVGVSYLLVEPVERMTDLVVHVASVVMVLYAFMRQEWAWFAVSVSYKSGLHAIVAFVGSPGSEWLSTHASFVELGLFSLFGCAGLGILAVLRRHWPTD